MPTPVLSDYIVVLENVLPSAVCDEIISEYANSKEWALAEVTKGVDLNLRKVESIPISHNECIKVNPKTRYQLDAAVFSAANTAITNYKNKFNNCEIEKDSGYDLLRYKTGCFYTEHVDSFTAIQRSVSCSFALNENYTGGEFAFFGGAVVKKIPKGAALLFPSSFTYPHEVKLVTSGTRYAIVTWFV
jgi:prolyl 4-hydroxylase